MAETLDVDGILQSAPQYKPITVEKEDIAYDLGHLCAYDYVPVDNNMLKASSTYLGDLTRDNVQLLFTKIFQLPAQVVTDGVLASLPKPTTIRPRAKPLPSAALPTSWEKFAKQKGIPKKSKKPQLTWDEEHQEYRRRFGYKRANNAADQWVIPVSASSKVQEELQKRGQDTVDPFTRIQQDKKAKQENQEKKQKKNKTTASLEKARSQASAGSKLKDDISRTFALVSRSTASLGRFDRRLPGETEAPREKGTRRVAGVGSAVSASGGGAEKKASLELIDKMMTKQSALDATKATANANRETQRKDSKRSRDELLSSHMKKQKRGKK